MALVKQAPAQTPATDAAAAVQPVGKFEEMDETTASAPAANDPPFDTDPTPPTAASASIPAPTASVPAVRTTSTAVAVQPEPSAFKKEVESMKGAADFAHGNYRVYKGQNGEIKQTGGGSLGRWAQVSMIAWDDHYEVSPGSDSDKSKEAVGYSKDGITLDSVIGRDKYGKFIGGPVSAYVEHLKDSDWANAKVGRFVDIACVVHESDSGKEVGEIIQVSLSQSSIPSFSSYQQQLEMKARAIDRGVKGIKVPENPFDFYIVREAAEKNGKSWTKLRVDTKLPADLQPRK